MIQADINPDQFLWLSSDSAKIQMSIDQAILQKGGIVNLGTRLYDLDTGLIGKSKTSDPFCTFTVKGSGYVGQINFHGTGSIWHIIGGKKCQLVDIGNILYNSNSQGVEIGNDNDTNSSSFTMITNVTVEPRTNTTGCTGFLIGTGRSGNDTSWVDIKDSEFYYTSSDTSTPYNRWKTTIAAGHIGFNFVGGNTLANYIYHCSSTGSLIGLKLDGGNKTTITNFGGGFNGLQVLCNGGNDLIWIGGRIEESGGIIIHGIPLSSGNQFASVKISGVSLDDSFSKDGILGLLSPGEIVGFHTLSNYVIDNLMITHQYYGDQISLSNIFLKSVGGQSNLILNGSYMSNIVPNTSRVNLDLTKIKPLQGSWNYINNGIKIPVVVSN